MTESFYHQTMQWQDEGIITRIIPFHEKSLRVFIFTNDHGLCHGILPFARSTKKPHFPQRGNRVRVLWQARLEDHVGQWKMETIASLGGFALSFGKKKLLVLESALALLASLLPERSPFPELYDDTIEFLSQLKNSDDDGITDYCRFEYQLLSHLGYGFNLDGGHEVILLDHGRGDSQTMARARGESFLPLPIFLWNHHATAEQRHQQQALALSGYFLEKILLSLRKHRLPDVRKNLAML